MAESALHPEKWVERYADYLYNYTLARISDRELAQDLVQDTFLAALGSVGNYKGDATERTWLIAILKRKIIDHYRKANSKKGKAEVRMGYRNNEDNEGDWLEERIADRRVKNKEEDMENQELGEAIYGCIDNLPKRQALVFKMKTLQGYDTEAICNELGITASNLWVMIHRARTTLMECLKINWM